MDTGVNFAEPQLLRLRYLVVPLREDTIVFDLLFALETCFQVREVRLVSDESVLANKDYDVLAVGVRANVDGSKRGQYALWIDVDRLFHIAAANDPLQVRNFVDLAGFDDLNHLARMGRGSRDRRSGREEEPAYDGEDRNNTEGTKNTIAHEKSSLDWPRHECVL